LPFAFLWQVLLLHLGGKPALTTKYARLAQAGNFYCIASRASCVVPLASLVAGRTAESHDHRKI
jgi:hypothetical protein